MAAIRLNLDPSDRQLSQFGSIGFIAFPFLGWFLSGRPSPTGWFNEPSILLALGAALGLAFGIIAFLKPAFLKYAFIAMTIAAYPIGFVISEIVVLLIYFLVFVPIGLVFRVMGRDALQREIDPQAKTYWETKDEVQDVESYFRQS